MAKTTEDIARDAVDVYLKGDTFNMHIEDMLIQARTELVTRSEKKARNWALGTAGLIIGIFAILTGLQFVDIRIKYAEIRNTHADIRNEFDEIRRTQGEIRSQSDEAKKLIKEIKNKLSNELEPAVVEAAARSRQVSENYEKLSSVVQSAIMKTNTIKRTLTNFEKKMPTMQEKFK